MLNSLDQALTNTRTHLLSLRNAAGHWEGELSSSALSTATAIVALNEVDAAEYREWIEAGVRWLIENQNADGGWGDTTISKSNLSTTLLCWSALSVCGEMKRAGHAAMQIPRPGGRSYAGALAGAATGTHALAGAATWIRGQVGSLEADEIAKTVIGRYGKDKTFSVPILMLCTIGGTMGEGAWKRVLPLPFELAALPRAWFGAVGMPVVSYALPALIAIGYARFKKAPPAWWNPLGWLRGALWKRIRPMLKALQPSSGGYLEATPLTSFVTMALAAAGDKEHPCIPGAVEFLKRSMRADGSWPIDTNLATWGTTLACKALGSAEVPVRQWLQNQQYQEVHPFTNAAPGGWAWTDLPGGVPDADDTAGALIGLKIQEEAGSRVAAEAGLQWLLDLQNRDGGMPTFCRGWGTLPFDRSSPELTAHALLAWGLWEKEMPEAMRDRLKKATEMALGYLRKTQRKDGSWIPLWFGNEHTSDEENPLYGTAQVVAYLSGDKALAMQADRLIRSGCAYLEAAQKMDGSWGGDGDAPASIEETAVAVHALLLQGGRTRASALRGIEWLIAATQNGTHFPSAPIGLYFARLWYHEKLYPVIWSLQAFRSAKAVLSSVDEAGTTTSLS
ncbi:squalene-hopene/tetraprenyl-beta-curcumene cyclase [Prosthecobacter fusiformis]|uniref:Squalene-hopene/tetraprenyl-beta-curcumene cyclase n=1 Tax=Prosthecobacter fusiformis TaxID=48464 RepID=A0A4R7STT7_9BACT|nr:prenyltransferase/squalene oxidase repeat-containing protein [Prosthecobacter fusiformis]TDU81707.1 squalene-hopene/tetraprenyl-beta-curcumene cyclase [Prosthecobacter fusiformis]